MAWPDILLHGAYHFHQPSLTLHVSRAHGELLTTILEMLRLIAHGKLSRQKPRDPPVTTTQSRECSGEEKPISDSTEKDKEKDIKPDPTTYEELRNILQQSQMPILVVFYSSKVPLTYHKDSNKQSKRCGDVCDTFENLKKSVAQDKVTFVKFDIEKSNAILEMCHVPTIKLYPGLEAEKNYPVEYFDDPLSVSNYKQFLKEEGVNL